MKLSKSLKFSFVYDQMTISSAKIFLQDFLENLKRKLKNFLKILKKSFLNRPYWCMQHVQIFNQHHKIAISWIMICYLSFSVYEKTQDKMEIIQIWIQMLNSFKRYSFSAVGSTSFKRMQIVSTPPALSKAPTVPLFSIRQISRPVAGKAKSTSGGRRRVEPRPDIGVYSKAACWSGC